MIPDPNLQPRLNQPTDMSYSTLHSCACFELKYNILKCTNQLYKLNTVSSAPRNNMPSPLTPLLCPSQSLCPPKGNHLPDLYHCGVVLPSSEFPIHGIRLSVFFLGLVSSISTLTGRCFCIAANGCGACILIAVWYSMLWLCYDWFAHSPVSGHSNLQLSWNSTVTNLPTGEQMCMALMGIHLGAELLGHQKHTCSAPWCLVNFGVGW